VLLAWCETTNGSPRFLYFQPRMHNYHKRRRFREQSCSSSAMHSKSCAIPEVGLRLLNFGPAKLVPLVEYSSRLKLGLPEDTATIALVIVLSQCSDGDGSCQVVRVCRSSLHLLCGIFEFTKVYLVGWDSVSNLTAPEEEGRCRSSRVLSESR
jgi:hypothetical protein